MDGGKNSHHCDLYGCCPKYKVLEILSECIEQIKAKANPSCECEYGGCYHSAIDDVLDLLGEPKKP